MELQLLSCLAVLGFEIAWIFNELLSRPLHEYPRLRLRLGLGAMLVSIIYFVMPYVLTLFARTYRTVAEVSPAAVEPELRNFVLYVAVVLAYLRVMDDRSMRS